MLSDEAREAKNKYAREWRRRNPEKANEIKERYLERKRKEKAKKEAKNKYAREWRKRNPEKVRATVERYWERKAQTVHPEHPEQTDKGGII